MQTNEILVYRAKFHHRVILEARYIRSFSEKGKREKLIFFLSIANTMKALSQRQIFVFAKVDLPTFLTLTDDDLKELGIAAFGARRKMLLTIQGELLVLSLNRK